MKVRGDVGYKAKWTPGHSLPQPALLVAQGRPGNLCQQMGFPCGSAGKESTCNAGELGSIPGFGRVPGEKKGYPL